MRQAAVLALTLALACGLFPAPEAAAQGRPACAIDEAFKELRDAAATDIGACQGDAMAATNGDLSQRTSKGLLMRRQADNWTAFLNAGWTWVLGPDGVAKRTNAERFAWEPGGDEGDGAMFSDASTGILASSDVAGGYSADARFTMSGPFMSSLRLEREGTTYNRLGPYLIVQTVWVLPTPELAHSAFADMANLERGDVALSTPLGDEAQVTGWRTDAGGGYSGRFGQVSVRARRSNAVVNVVVAPAPRLETALQLTSMIIARLV